MTDTYHWPNAQENTVKKEEMKRQVGTGIVRESLKDDTAQWLRAWMWRLDGTEFKFHFYHL